MHDTNEDEGPNGPNDRVRAAETHAANVKVEIVDCGLLDHIAVPAIPGDLEPMRAMGLLTTKVRSIPMLQAIHSLGQNEAIRLRLDHDPAPLREILSVKHPGVYTWEPVTSGPDEWIVLIRRAVDAPDAPVVR